ncbi:N-acetylmuramoyl-L-alanine amidase [Brevinema andersonii]|uniref:N-acetylmuramoyl-L-alanine amidase n=1 Tax=Brevinema andersonii TaxID=34097 RepID=A0A1I1FEN7_BREAD|nr:peptidoglycan recognition family protein [Brevinema andersonii]SFB97835.1 N-acetylmuramoyl-L-alanine amidase [Brevinema andersonii]
MSKKWYQLWDKNPSPSWIGKEMMVHTPVILVKEEKKHYRHIIENDHVMIRGWINPGYTFVIEFDGSVWYCPETAKYQIHCRSGGQNKKSLGMCLIGDGTKQEPSLKQMKALEELIVLHKSPSIIYHRDFSSKECPGDRVIHAIARSPLGILVRRYQ